MNYFGTDGIRGKAYDFITYELAYAVGRSMELLETKQVVIARDTRESGSMIVNALKAGIIDAGLAVLDLEIVATPILALMSIKMACIGIMVTASHNPYEDNGIKVLNRGIKTNPEEEAKIEAVIRGEVGLKNKAKGTLLPSIDPLTIYERIFEDFIVKSDLKIALDLANGATINSANYIFNKIGKNHQFIGDKPNGTNINKGVGSTHMENLVDFVLQHQCDVGFAFDGDGDRVLAVDDAGNIVDGDLMIYVIACYLQEQGLLNNHLVVLTKMSNIGIIEALHAKGIKVIQTNVGDKYVVEALHQNDASIGGESSGHIINRNLFVSGDGVLNAAYLVMILETKKQSLRHLIQDVTMYPDKLVNLRNVDKDLVNHPLVIELVQNLKADLGSKGKVLVRASGTEPLIRISASAKTMAEVDEMIQKITDTIETLSKERK